VISTQQRAPRAAHPNGQARLDAITRRPERTHARVDADQNQLARSFIDQHESFSPTGYYNLFLIEVK
jgi:hypothetical protein